MPTCMQNRPAGVAAREHSCFCCRRGGGRRRRKPEGQGPKLKSLQLLKKGRGLLDHFQERDPGQGSGRAQRSHTQRKGSRADRPPPASDRPRQLCAHRSHLLLLRGGHGARMQMGWMGMAVLSLCRQSLAWGSRGFSQWVFKEANLGIRGAEAAGPGSRLGALLCHPQLSCSHSLLCPGDFIYKQVGNPSSINLGEQKNVKGKDDAWAG